MLCYKDRTFCNLCNCKKFNECPDALTEKVQKAADTWWKGFKSPDPAPISINSDIPTCYEPVAVCNDAETVLKDTVDLQKG